MKNMSVVLIVLAMASAGNAALDIDIWVDGVQQPHGSIPELRYPIDTAGINITGDGQTLSPQALYLFSVGPGTISGGSMKYTGSLSDIYEGYPGLDDPWIMDAGYPKPSSVVVIELADGSIPPAPLSGLLVQDILFVCQGECLVTLFLTDYDDPTIVYDMRVINQIPEPMSLCLFGLGGLFFRRRK